MNPDNLTDLILYKGDDWKPSLLNAREVLQDKFLSDKSLIRIAINSTQISHFNTIIKFLYQDSKERPVGITGIDYLVKAVNYSNYSFKDWIVVIDRFSQWIQKENRQTSFLKLLGYLQCCEESPETKDISKPFIDLVNEMLEQYGFVG